MENTNSSIEKHEINTWHLWEARNALIEKQHKLNGLAKRYPNRYDHDLKNVEAAFRAIEKLYYDLNGYRNFANKEIS